MVSNEVQAVAVLAVPQVLCSDRGQQDQGVQQSVAVLHNE